MREILAHLGEPTSPPHMAPARGPPLWERADLARRGALVPWVTETASAPAPATHGTTCVVILARFSGFISMQFPRDDC